ncbi:cytochrome c peroxidase, partial [Sphaerotilus montanus]|uniref:cytochrome c peroxidase n=1 Tax=Sphaerotilus montanus TaxID=522889 RepID=UPI003FA2751C
MRDHPTRSTWRFAALPALLTALGLSACGGGDTDVAVTAPDATPVAVTAVTRLSVGEAMFNDKSLSASGQQACASCHATPAAHADPAGTLLPLGGVAMDRQGTRSSPSLLYLAANAAFRFTADGTPRGGFTRKREKPRPSGRGGRAQ